MSVHQYIGARYVPYYYENSLDPTSTEWEPNVHYEALTVVTLPNSHSYISKKDVPDTVGSPALNADYWLDTGSDNAYIQNLQDQIDQINLDLGDINNDITALENSVDEILHGGHKKIVFITDSYGTHAVTNFAQRTASILGLPATDWFLFAEGSSGFDHAGLAGHNFEQLLTVNMANVPDPAEITDVIFAGGANDIAYFQSDASLTSAINSALAYAASEFSNANIWTCFMGYYSLLAANFVGYYTSALTDYAKATLAAKHHFINAYDVLHNIYFRDDQTHPNENGNVALANVIVSALLGCDKPLVVSNFYNIDIDAPAGITISGTSKLGFKVDGDHGVVRINEYTLTGTITWTAGTNVQLGTYSMLLAPIISGLNQMYEIPLVVTHSGGTTVEMVRMNVIDSGTPNVAMLIANPFTSLTGVTSIKVPYNTFNIPLCDM